MYNLLSVFLQLKFETEHRYPFKNTSLFPLPTQHNVETQMKLKVLVFKNWAKEATVCLSVGLFIGIVQKRIKCNLLHDL